MADTKKDDIKSSISANKREEFSKLIDRNLPVGWLENDRCPPAYEARVLHEAGRLLQARLWEKLIGEEQAGEKKKYGNQKSFAKHLVELGIPRVDALEVELSNVFNGNHESGLKLDVAIAVYQVRAEAMRHRPHTFEDKWRDDIGACLHVLSQPQFAGREDSPEAFRYSLDWSSSVTIVSGSLDPVMRTWDRHPLDTTVHDLLRRDKRLVETPNRSNPQVELVCPSVADLKRWICRMTLPHFVHLHKASVENRNADRDGFLRTVNGFLEPLAKLIEDEREHIKLFTVPENGFPLPFVMTDHGGIKQCYLNLHHVGSPEFHAVPCRILELALARATSASNARFKPEKRHFKREMIDLFEEIFEQHERGDTEAASAFGKGDGLFTPPAAMIQKIRRPRANARGQVTT